MKSGRNGEEWTEGKVNSYDERALSTTSSEKDFFYFSTRALFHSQNCRVHEFTISHI